MICTSNLICIVKMQKEHAVSSRDCCVPPTIVGCFWFILFLVCITDCDCLNVVRNRYIRKTIILTGTDCVLVLNNGIV
jgi:hypothetical protein